MSLVGVMVLSSFLVIMVDMFYLMFWFVGLSTVVGGFYLYSNLSVEYVGSFMWNGGFSCLVVMSVWVVGLCFLCTSFYKLNSSLMFSVCMISMLIMSVMFFMSSNWFVLYFFFECSLVPIIVLILGWGYQPERLQAAGYLLMYTMCASLPFLMMMVFGYWEDGVMSFMSVGGYSGGLHEVGWWVLFPLLMVFMVKLPVFGVHSWLPKAHVEAPVSGSMVLAGVLLKFGGVGCLLVFYYFMLSGGMMVDFVISLGLWGGFLCSWICMSQVDLKSLIAYSSIGHMSLCFAGILGCFSVGWVGGVILMVSHGFCSPGLFALASYLYGLFSSRSLYVCCGVLGLVPGMSLCWFLLCSSNMAFPPSFSVLGELLLLMSVIYYSIWFVFPICFMIFLVGVYSLLMFSSIQYGSVGRLSIGGGVLGCEYLIMVFLLWVPLNAFLLGSDLLFSWW